MYYFFRTAKVRSSAEIWKFMAKNVEKRGKAWKSVSPEAGFLRIFIASQADFQTY
jgi:hypothetical protein